MDQINPNYYKNENTQSSLIDILHDHPMDYLAFDLGNAIKYIYRAGRKESFKQDIEKALTYLNFFLAKVATDTEFNQTKRVVNTQSIFDFVNSAEITPHQKEWLIDLLQFSYGSSKNEFQENLKLIKDTVYSIKCYLNQQDLI